MMQIACLIAHYILPGSSSCHINAIGYFVSEHLSWMVIHPLLSSLDTTGTQFTDIDSLGNEAKDLFGGIFIAGSIFRIPTIRTIFRCLSFPVTDHHRSFFNAAPFGLLRTTLRTFRHLRFLLFHFTGRSLFVRLKKSPLGGADENLDFLESGG